MEKFQLSKFADAGAKLLADVTAEFKRLGLDTSKLPKVFPDDSGKIKLVFVGQYSAGKSSIIKMLTGEDVETGAGITTQNFSSYDWNGLEIVDTPGIHTELRPDHDEITYEQINHAALLIFVITNEGFSQRMGDHFRKLAIEQKRADNIVLVVNKMDRTALGNVPEQQKIIAEDLSRVTKPYQPGDLFVSFVDTASYFKALEETDERRKKRRLDKSGHDIFVENLNRFVAAKGILQKINLPLNTIAAAINKALSGNSDKNNADMQVLIETFRHEKKIILNSRDECIEDVKRIIENFKTKVARRGRESAESATSQKTKEDAKKVLSAAQERVKSYTEDCAQEISDCIKKFAEKSETRLKDYEQTTFVKNVKSNILGKFNVEGGSDFVQGGAAVLGVGGAAAGAFVFQEGAQIAAQFAQVGITPLGNVVGNAVGVGTGIFAESALAGTDGAMFAGLIGKGTGELVKKLPFFQAEPTFINKIAGAFTGNGSKILGGAVAGIATVFSLMMLHRESKKAEEAERQLQQNREDIRTGFNDVADDIGRDLLNNVRNFMTQNVDPIIDNFDKQIKNIESQVSGAQVKSEKLTAMLKRTENLITEIQACK